MSAPYSRTISSGVHDVLKALTSSDVIASALAGGLVATFSPRVLCRLRTIQMQRPVCRGRRNARDHALVDQALERLGRGHVAQVEEHLVPEAGVEQVQHGVFGAADVEVDAPKPLPRPRK